MTVSSLRELLAKATPRPWFVNANLDVESDPWPFVVAGVGALGSHEQTEPDAALIVEAVNSLPAYLELEEAARDPFLALLESHPDCDPVANAEMKRAADRLRAALAGLTRKETT